MMPCGSRKKAKSEETPPCKDALLRVPPLVLVRTNGSTPIQILHKYIVGNGNTHRSHYFMSSYDYSLSLILRRFCAIGNQRKYNACLFFSPVQPFKDGIAYLFRTKTIDEESKCNNHRESVHVGIIAVLQPDIFLYLAFSRHTAFIYSSDGGTECRGDYPEQLHQFRLTHQYIGNVFWNDCSAALGHCNDIPFHTYDIDSYTSFILLPILSSSMEKSLSSFSVVILA